MLRSSDNHKPRIESQQESNSYQRRVQINSRHVAELPSELGARKDLPTSLQQRSQVQVHNRCETQHTGEQPIPLHSEPERARG